jgi:hypothetical protein
MKDQSSITTPGGSLIVVLHDITTVPSTVRVAVFPGQHGDRGVMHIDVALSIDNAYTLARLLLSTADLVIMRAQGDQP